MDEDVGNPSVADVPPSDPEYERDMDVLHLGFGGDLYCHSYGKRFYKIKPITSNVQYGERATVGDVPRTEHVSWKEQKVRYSILAPVAPYSCPVCGADEKSYGLRLESHLADKNKLKVYGYCRDCGQRDDVEWVNVADMPHDTFVMPCVNANCGPNNFAIITTKTARRAMKAANYGRIFCYDCGDCCYGGRLYDYRGTN